MVGDVLYIKHVLYNAMNIKLPCFYTDNYSTLSLPLHITIHIVKLNQCKIRYYRLAKNKWNTPWLGSLKNILIHEFSG